MSAVKIGRNFSHSSKHQPKHHVMDEGKTALVQFITSDGDKSGAPFSIPLATNVKSLHVLLNKSILQNEDPLPYTFSIEDVEIVDSINNCLEKTNLSGDSHDEVTVPIVYHPQAIFRVKCVTHCSSTLPGHDEAILNVSFSPDGKLLATGSGDHTVRIWDMLTETPIKELKAHRDWVLYVEWSPDGKTLASGSASKDPTIRLWSRDGNCRGVLRGHKKFITALSWEPYHRNRECKRLVSASKDASAKVWDVTTRRLIFTLGGHNSAVTCVKWGGEGYIYTGSEDKTIRVWDGDKGTVVHRLQGHGHWINTLALNTDYALRAGPFDYHGNRPEDDAEAVKAAYDRWFAAKGKKHEKLLSGSDDFTMFLWDPLKSFKPLKRITGHSKPINVVRFSPNGQWIASASFDRTVKIWTSSGRYVATLRGHVSEVYQLCWSGDSRLLVSGSRDSTVKVWDMKTKKLKMDLPGHLDEVYSVDWSVDGERVASGSKDRMLKIWRYQLG